LTPRSTPFARATALTHAATALSSATTHLTHSAAALIHALASLGTACFERIALLGCQYGLSLRAELLLLVT
jgi:hypothetical protein